MSDDIVHIQLLPPRPPRCASRWGPARCSREDGHDGSHQEWTRAQDALPGPRPPDMEVRDESGNLYVVNRHWLDCPTCLRVCGVAEIRLMGECGACWATRQPVCEHGNIKGGYCERCDSRDAALWRDSQRVKPC